MTYHATMQPIPLYKDKSIFGADMRKVPKLSTVTFLGHGLQMIILSNIGKSAITISILHIKEKENVSNKQFIQ